MVWRQSPGAHPRLRGEHSHPPRPMPGYVGSSPLTRGARPAISTFPRSVRLIPAYAGSTRWAGLYKPCLLAHPRLRGEHGLLASYGRAYPGSSPLTRGARTSAARGRPVSGLIPAYAGSTAGEVMVWSGSAAHPRLRGEHQLSTRAIWNRCGSSPLTRGARRRLICRGRRLGLIPAYAGST